MIDQLEIDIRFTYHAPSSADVANMQRIQETAKALAELIVDVTPTSREQSLALTKLEECVMHANSGMVRRDAEE